ncbi:CYTH domain-containing protein [Nocardia cyriacigeorgica]|nr:CYTH domain-containing protein [Nocardia cyriacigeorgica]MBF6401257.1 CYTH domain-containing protein [Nocardia cyriacigeorgica]
MTYQDTYYDTLRGDLDRTGREFRLRTVEESSGDRRNALTFKDPAVDDATGSKPEFETRIADSEAMRDIVVRLLPRTPVVRAARPRSHRAGVPDLG